MFRRSLPVNPRIIGLIAMLIAGLASYIGYKAIDGVPGYPYSMVTVNYPTASNLVIHDDVREDSQRIGQVSSITYRHGAAAVLLQMNPGTKVYANATAGIGDVSSLGSEFVELNPGTASAGPIGPGGVPTNHTTTPVELDTVLSILNPKVSDQLAAAVQTLGVGVSGQGQNLNDLIGDSTTLLPNLGTTMSTLADPSTNLTGLIDSTNLLASRFDGRSQQIAQLLSEFDTTLKAVNTNATSSLQDTIADTAPALPPAIPALQSLSAAAAQTGTALQDLQPGFQAAGENTPNLRALFRESVAPLDLATPVGRQAVPALTDLANTNQKIESPTVPFLSQLINDSDPLLTYLAPYSNDTYSLFSNLQSALSVGNGDGDWLRIGIFEGSQAVTSPIGSPASASSASSCRDPYPAPGQAYKDGAEDKGTCP
jgi:phospholipid/cholesterol/gamma-HCH transport system substrate-binding protein